MERINNLHKPPIFFFSTVKLPEVSIYIVQRRCFHSTTEMATHLWSFTFMSFEMGGGRDENSSTHAVSSPAPKGGEAPFPTDEADRGSGETLGGAVHKRLSQKFAR